MVEEESVVLVGREQLLSGKRVQGRGSELGPLARAGWLGRSLTIAFLP